jgi:hypothetical protein
LIGGFEAGVLRIGGNTDNLHPGILPVRAALTYLFTQRIFSQKVPFSHRVADDCNRCPVTRIALVKRTARRIGSPTARK